MMFTISNNAITATVHGAESQHSVYFVMTKPHHKIKNGVTLFGARYEPRLVRSGVHRR